MSRLMEPWVQRQENKPPRQPLPAVVTILIIVLIVAVAWWGLHTWYVDTHCTTILGTQVCQ